MDEESTAKAKGFLKKNWLLGCIIFAACNVCVVGLAAVPFWLSYQSQRVVSANATSTAFAVTTQQANREATAVAREVQQDDYEFIERFDIPSNLWRSGPEDDEYWKGQISIEDGVYIWNADEVKQTFLYTAGFDQWNTDSIKDFDVYLDTKFIEGIPGAVCGGLLFRNSPGGWENGVYTFSVCNDSHFEIYYYELQNWEAISDWQYNNAILTSDWNRLEISARENHFTFIINNEIVFETMDDRRKKGSLEILFETQEEAPAVIWFDNFGYQSR